MLEISDEEWLSIWVDRVIKSAQGYQLKLKFTCYIYKLKKNNSVYSRNVLVKTPVNGLQQICPKITSRY